MACKGFFCSLPQRDRVPAHGLLFSVFFSRQNVHLCGYVHNYNLLWKAIPSIWQAGQWPECWPHVVHAVNTLKYQTQLISPFWKPKMRHKGQSWEELHAEKRRPAQVPRLTFSWAQILCVVVCLFVNLQDFGAWEPWSPVVLAAASPFDRQSQRHVAFGTFHIQKCYCFKHAYFKIYNFPI